ncbi:hypothetical protein CY34DRAFT_19879 [Suillus luteus UH-Slu-Lm8-n1]|uniref:Uncharacterized protein n=1 Tax=Suillus luteus UH-Slu-Lm8-n1 TaxID=930992 RepID=A0A0D0A013_9AGAM|nr:hypothetical protein CY34DRAFT_19879 [Suillus luteus UH-Slu-Lm8-n1]
MRDKPSHPECLQNPGRTNIVISEMLLVVNITLAILYFVITLLFHFATNSVPEPLDDALQALDEEPSHPEQPQDSGEVHITGVQQVVITGV